MTTLVLDNIPAGCLLGIDLQFLNAPAEFRGFKLIPPGVHVLHWSAPAAAGLDLRLALFFAATGTPLRMAWDDEADQFVAADPPESSASSAGLLAYPQSVPAFASLTPNLTLSVLTALLPARPGPVSSVTASGADSILLAPGAAPADPDAFRFLRFDLKKQRTWREGAVGREITLAALDRSWFLGDIVGRERAGAYAAVLAEFELAFVLVVLLANYSAAEQWKRILELLATCKAAVHTHADIYLSLLETLFFQLECVPLVYFNDLLGPAHVKTQLRTLRKTLLDPSSFEQSPAPIVVDRRREMLDKIADIAGLLASKFAVDLDGGTNAAAAARRRQHESSLPVLSGSARNGFEGVHHYGSDDEDDVDAYDTDDEEHERGEFAPVVVDL